jgi:hypothetical protein
MGIINEIEKDKKNRYIYIQKERNSGEDKAYFSLLLHFGFYLCSKLTIRD